MYLSDTILTHVLASVLYRSHSLLKFLKSSSLMIFSTHFKYLSVSARVASLYKTAIIHRFRNQVIDYSATQKQTIDILCSSSLNVPFSSLRFKITVKDLNDIKRFHPNSIVELNISSRLLQVGSLNVHRLFQSLPQLQTIAFGVDRHYIHTIVSLLEVIECKSVKSMKFYCTCVVSLIEAVDLNFGVNLVQLKSLELSGSFIQTVDVKNLSNLESLEVNSCPHLTAIKGVDSLSSLTRLSLTYLPLCDDFSDISVSSCITDIEMFYTKIERSKVPLMSLKELKYLKLNSIDDSMVGTCSIFSKIITLYLGSCSGLTRLAFEKTPQLQQLTLWQCGSLLSVDLSLCRYLRKFVVENCIRLQECRLSQNLCSFEFTVREINSQPLFQGNFTTLPNCYSLNVTQCSSTLTNLVNSFSLSALTMLSLTRMTLTNSIHSFLLSSNARHLKSLTLKSVKCRKILIPKSVKHLEIVDGQYLDGLTLFEENGLRTISIQGMESLTNFHLFSSCQLLSWLSVTGCPHIESLDGIDALRNLTIVKLRDLKLASTHLNKLHKLQHLVSVFVQTDEGHVTQLLNSNTIVGSVCAIFTEK
ncbi:hypothetical protein RCL1_004392 [Eukaryota sp. TZLM3-RCL]